MHLTIQGLSKEQVYLLYHTESRGGCGLPMHPVHLQLHGFCLGSVAGEAALKQEAAMSSIRGLTDRVFHSLNVKVCTFQSNFVALNGH